MINTIYGVPASPPAFLLKAVYMSQQRIEKIHYEGEERPLYSEPLALWLTAHPRWRPAAPHDALKRGYAGKWAVVGSKLYLTAITLYLRSDSNAPPSKVANLNDVFDWRQRTPHGVFADWYTGTLKIPNGPFVPGEWGYYGYVYDTYLDVPVDRGVVQRRRQRMGRLERGDESDDV